VRCATIGRVGRPTVITRRIEEQLAAMRDAGVTQERAAIACNIGRRTVQRWEARRGREPEPQTLEEVLASLPTLEEIMADDRPRPLGRRRRSRKRDWQKAARMLEQEAPERWDLR
jgi:transcriptional regulator with XRE-family HTH domain